MNWFQSLNRAYKRSDLSGCSPIGSSFARFNPSIGLTSVPTHHYTTIPASLCGCFNPSIGLTSVPTPSSYAYELRGDVSIPQSGLQAFRPHIRHLSLFRRLVSIPQSGLQAFRLPEMGIAKGTRQWFQSLNRAYKRSDCQEV